VLSQVYNAVAHVEYIISDDGSSCFDKDWVLQTIQDVSQSGSGVSDINVYTNEKNLGTVRSFNKAIGQAAGDIIIPLSCGDQFFSKNSVDEIIQSFKETSFPMVTGFREIVDDKKIIAKAPKRKLIRLFEKGNEIKLLKTLAIRGNFISGACTYYCKDFLEEIGGFDESFRLLEDYPIYMKALNSGYGIAFINKTFMKHAVGGVSDSSRSVNKILSQDFAHVKIWIETNVDMNFFEKRLFKYFQIFTKKERLSFVNLIRYPDCFVYWAILSIQLRISS
jgi:GT2 family glycosyltransferase